MIALFCAVLGLQSVQAQEQAPSLGTKSTYHNQLFFNRFLINPTFSLVREDKSYITLLHRNQYATFEDNDQNYFLGFSNKLNETTALGASVYSQWSGVVQEFGFNANYAKAIRLSDKNSLTFGTNLTYFTEGIDRNRIITADADNAIEDSQKESQIAIQPGITLSMGQFDFGVYATDLFKYNQTTNEFSTNLGAKTVRASVQYTYEFMQNRGMLANARLMPLVQVGQQQDGSMNYIGSILLDLPDYGWFQTNFDMEYGLSAGLGFNLSKKMSLGYLLERDIVNQEADLGWNHEVTLAYTLDREHNAKGLFAEGSEDAKVDRIVRNYEEQILALKAEVEKNKAAINKRDALAQAATTQNDNVAVANTSKGTDTLKKTVLTGDAASEFDDRDVMEAMLGQSDTEANDLAYENRLILDELILRQDSIAAARAAAFDERLAAMVAVLKDSLQRSMQTPQQRSEAYRTAVAVNNARFEAMNKKNVSAAGYATEAISKKKDALEAEVSAPVAAVSKSAPVEKIIIVEKKTPMVDVAEAVAENANTSDIASEKAYTRTVQFEPVSKVLGEIITKPAVTLSGDAGNMKDGVKLPIKTMKKSDLVGVTSGYYVIANVFKSRKYLDAFLGDLKKKGLDAGYFYNKENGLHYVYLADYNYKSDAKTAYVSNMNGQYSADKWIMQVDNTSSIVDNFYEDQ